MNEQIHLRKLTVKLVKIKRSMKLKIVMLFVLIVGALQMNAQIIVSGMMVDPVGGDAGYEYIQLMATEDIDFAATPYSVVRCINTGTLGSVTADGWATGGIRTFKFDLKSGKAAKGTYFYVGGEKKVIAGSWKGAVSTDISENAGNAGNRANWIRNITYKGAADSEVVGDGFGEKTDNLLPNGAAAPLGVAVFAGTTVTASSIPIDVIFLATAAPLSTGSLLAAFNVALNTGYHVTDTDYYSTKKSKYFADGENLSAILYPTAKGLNLEKDSGQFLMLGGVYNTAKKKWDKARGSNYISLCKDRNDPATAALPQLSDIEKAKGATKLK